MPKYVYKCSQGHEFEVFQKFTDKPLEKCKCGMKCKRVIQSNPVIFKGSGFYVKDKD